MVSVLITAAEYYDEGVAASSSEPGFWVYALTYGLAIAVFVGFTLLALWGRRRRQSGVEASTSNAEGAEAIIAQPW